MIKKIYRELVLIRKELQAIRKCLELNSETEFQIQPEKLMEHINKVTKETGASPLII